MLVVVLLFEDTAYTKNIDLLHLRQKLLKLMEDLKCNYVRKHSSISPSTMVNLKRKREDTPNKQTPRPQKRQKRDVPAYVIDHFRTWLIDNSEPADSSTKRVIVGGIEREVRRITLPKEFLCLSFLQSLPKPINRYYTLPSLTKYWPREFKNLPRKTRVCPLCKRHSEVAIHLNKFLPDFELPQWACCPIASMPTTQDIEDEYPIRPSDRQKSEIKQCKKLLSEYKSLDLHIHLKSRIKALQRARRADYASQPIFWRSWLTPKSPSS